MPHPQFTPGAMIKRDTVELSTHAYGSFKNVVEFRPSPSCVLIGVMLNEGIVGVLEIRDSEIFKPRFCSPRSTFNEEVADWTQQCKNESDLLSTRSTSGRSTFNEVSVFFG